MIEELKPDPIKYSTEERWAVFIIERAHQNNEDVTEKVTQCVAVFETPNEANKFIRSNHRKGNVYFIVEGWCMG